MFIIQRSTYSLEHLGYQVHNKRGVIHRNNLLTQSRNFTPKDTHQHVHEKDDVNLSWLGSICTVYVNLQHFTVSTATAVCTTKLEKTN